MTDRLNIKDEVLKTAGAYLVSASSAMVEGNRAVPAGTLQSLSGIGGDVRRFLVGLHTARLALADAAKTTSVEVAGVMRDSSALDAYLAQALYTGFAVEGSRR